ncbi:MAG: glycogen/starch synthase [bacterium]
MKGKLKLLMVFPEVAPFAKTGSVGDIGGALPKVLKDFGHDVRIISPQYRIINERKYVLRDVIRLQNIPVSLGKKNINVHVKSAFLPNSKVQVYFIDYKPFFFKDGLYSDPKSGEDYSDNDRRFILFSKAVLGTLTKLQWQPDIIHCYGWQSALVPFFLRVVHKDDPFFSKICSVLTVDNFAAQGDFDSSCVSCMGVNEDFIFEGSPTASRERFNFLREGIRFADILTTVSASYGEEVRSYSEFGCGMEDLLKSYKDRFSGIASGIDESVWNPESDDLIPKKYSILDPSGKDENKRALLVRFGLPVSDHKPVLAMVSRLTEQKGIDLVKEGFDEIMRMDFIFILLGQGDKAYQKYFENLRKKYPDRVGVNFTYNDALAHLIVAGADMILSPSKIEPCGLTHLYGLKYGTVPIVRNTGGLADTVQPYDPKTGKGTGFVFNDAKVSHMLKAIKQAVRTYGDRNTWLQIMNAGMQTDLSWQNSAKKYVQLYGKCISKKR